jgi:glycosyltransferase involved in cell wall biosynthesis
MTKTDAKNLLTVVFITFNEEDNILRSLKAVKTIADEIIVLDSFSTDQTVAIAENYGAQVIQRTWEGYAASKNYLNRLAQTDYVLSLDADEVLSEELQQEILIEKAKGFKGVYSINRLTNYCGRWIKHGGWYPDNKPRLFNKKECYWEGEFVHETLFIPKHVKVRVLTSDCYHYTYKDEKDHRDRAEKYAILTANKLLSQGKKISALKPYFSAVARFTGMYLFKLGFLDGVSGYKIAKISGWCNWVKYKELRRITK